MPNEIEISTDTLGSALRFAREAKDVSVGVVASMTGYSHSQISNIEHNQTRPSARLLDRYQVAIDSLSCQRKECKGRVSCEKCTVASIVKVFSFRPFRALIKHQKVSDQEQVSDSLGIYIDGLMDKLNMTPEQQAQAQTRIFRSALEICLEITKQSD